MMLTNCCVLFTGYAWSHVMCSAGAISALLFPLVCALCLHSECHFFLCSYVETACTLLFFCKHTCTQTYTQTWKRTGNTKSHLLTLYGRLYSLIYCRLGVQYDEDHVRSFSNGKLLELFRREYTCPVFHVCYVVYHSGHSTMQHMFNNKVPLFWQFKSGWFNLLDAHHRVLSFYSKCDYIQKPLLIHILFDI